jgi:hypothetical protein
MQPKPVPSLPKQLTLPLEKTPLRTDPPQGTEQAVVGRCTPEETWETLSPPGRDQLCRTWLRVLKEVVDDA